MEYHLKYISPEELPRIYPYLERDFAPEERKTEARLKLQMEQGTESGVLLMADGREAGYAFLVRHPAVSFVLLDYIAVHEPGKGHGTALITLLQNEYLEQGILAEVDRPEEAVSPADREKRQLTLGFYRKAGFVPVPVKNSIYSVSYLIHYWSMAPVSEPRSTVAAALDTLYALQLPYEDYAAHVKIDLE